MKKLRPVRPLRRRPVRHAPHPIRRGSVLIIVLVIVMLLTYGVYGFTERMLAEARAAEAHGRAVQATHSAESGIEYAASLIAARAADPEAPVSLYHEPGQFAGIVVQESSTASVVARFSLVAPVAGDATYRQVRYGISDESGKLNLNALSSLGLDETQQLTLLMSLPDMTEEIADAILDFIDEDDEVRLYGAEYDYYLSLAPPYEPTNGPIGSLNELLRVRGVTPELLFGEDANRNGLLDPSENDGAASPPLDDADGVLRPGWINYFTVFSSESNASITGEAKIDINQALLTDLYDAIVEAMDDEDAAQFIVAYRLNGPTDPENSSQPANSDESSNGADGGNSGGGDSGGGDTGGDDAGGGGTGGGGTGGGDTGGGDTGGGDTGGGDTGGGDTGGGNSGGGVTNSQAQAIDQTAGKLGQALGGNVQGSVTRGGLDLSKGAQFEIGSLYDLVGREVQVEIDGSQQTLTSPFTVENIQEALPKLSQQFALSETTTVKGRVNVNEAPYEILVGIPGMTPEIAEAIVAGRVDGTGQALSETPERRTTAWLVETGIVDLPTLRNLDKYLTARGDIFKVQSVGFFEGGGPFSRIEAIIDGSVTPAKIISYRDLSDLGRGYPPSQLLPASGQTVP